MRIRLGKKLGKIGRIRTEMTGKPCAICGATHFQVVLQRETQQRPESFMARCTRCQGQRDLERDGAKAAVLFRYGRGERSTTVRHRSAAA